MNICVFVCNKNYFDKFIDTYSQLLTNGKYTGPSCLVIGDDLKNNDLLNHEIIKNNDIIIKYFPEIKFSQDFFLINNKIISDKRNITKKFQWHKLHLFNIFFKRWNSVFYIDCGMTILNDIYPILNTIEKNTLLAHCDAHPNYKWKLNNQFCKENKDCYNKLINNYNLNVDYFQTGILLYDTQIIEKDTYINILKLANNYPISKTNEQGILNLYFNCDKKIWKQIQLRNEDTNFYHYCCIDLKDTEYIIVKYKNW